MFPGEARLLCLQRRRLKQSILGQQQSSACIATTVWCMLPQPQAYMCIEAEAHATNQLCPALQLTHCFIPLTQHGTITSSTPNQTVY